MPDTPIVEVRGLTKHFVLPGEKKTVKACQNVSFAVLPGRTLGLVGESGSGKTTVGRCLVRLLEIDGGEVYFKGERIDSISRRRFRSYRKHLQIVFQEPSESLNPLRSVKQTLVEPLKLHTSLSRTEVARRIEAVLGYVGLSPSVASARPSELSAGDQQRVAIARAIATRPEFIVLDEPTSALPPDAKPGIIRLLSQLQDEFHLGYLFISHDLTLVRHFCHEVAVMYLGQIVESGQRDVVLGRPGHPYSWGLLSSVLLPDPRNGRLFPRSAVRLQGEIPSPVDLPVGCYLEGRCPFAQPRCTQPQELRQMPAEPEHQVRCWRAVEGELQIAESPDDRFGGTPHRKEDSHVVIK